MLLALAKDILSGLGSCFGVERDNVICWNTRAFWSAYMSDRHRLFLRQ